VRAARLLGIRNVDIQNQHPDKEGTAPPAARDGAPANPGRRRFTRAGIGASGVILTLASDPALATGTTTPFMCRSPSGSLSGGLQSHPGTQTVVCNGVSPGYWKNHQGSWPAGCYPTKTSKHAATTFASVFPFGSTTLYQSGTMLAVLTNIDPNQDPYNLGMHLVSAYLNVLSGKINYFTVAVLKGMWHDLVSYGYYSPTAGIKWYAYDIKKYLESTEH
jgi:hypothetical protein